MAHIYLKRLFQLVVRNTQENYFNRTEKKFFVLY